MRVNAPFVGRRIRGVSGVGEKQRVASRRPLEGGATPVGDLWHRECRASQRRDEDVAEREHPWPHEGVDHDCGSAASRRQYEHQEPGEEERETDAEQRQVAEDQKAIATTR